MSAAETTDVSGSTQPATVLGNANSNNSSFRKHRTHSDPFIADLLGNLPLHHAFARTPQLQHVETLLRENKDAAQAKNQFGRLPLHYAVDHLRPNIEAVRLLVNAYPLAASTAAADGSTPYDISMKWGHSQEMLRLLLNADPKQDPRALFALKFGPAATIYFWLKARTKTVQVGDTLPPQVPAGSGGSSSAVPGFDPVVEEHHGPDAEAEVEEGQVECAASQDVEGNAGAPSDAAGANSSAQTGDCSSSSVSKDQI